MNSDMLKGKIKEAALTQGEVASSIGLSLSRFNAKLNNTHGAEFSLGEVRAIKSLLQLTVAQVDDIFFAEKVS